MLYVGRRSVSILISNIKLVALTTYLFANHNYKIILYLTNIINKQITFQNKNFMYAQSFYS